MKKLWRKLRQGLDRAIYEGRFKQFIWLSGVLILAFIIVLLLAAVFRFDLAAASPGSGSSSDSAPVLVRLIELLLDPGAFVGSGSYNYVFFQLFVVLVGATFFTSFLIGTIGNLLSRRVDSLTDGRYTYAFEDHILILGAGSALKNLLSQISDTGSKCDIVIQTTQSPETVRDQIRSFMLKPCEKDIYVIYGSRTDMTALADLRFKDAREIYILGEDDEPQHDGLNLKCWNQIMEECKGNPGVKPCYLMLDRITSHHAFAYKKDNGSTPELRLNVISAVENAVQGVLVSGEVRGVKYQKLDREGIGKDSDVNVHLIVVGMTQTAYAFATTAAHICHFPNFRTKNKKTKITFIQKDIREEMDFWMGHYSNLMDLSYAEYRKWDASGTPQVKKFYPKPEYINPVCSDEKGFLDIEWEFIDAGVEDANVRNYIRECVKKDGLSEYLSFAVCGHDAEANVAAAMYLPGEVYENDSIPVFVYQPLTRFVMYPASETSKYSNMYPFGMRGDCFDPKQERLLWAKRIKFVYDMCGKYGKMEEQAALDDRWYDAGNKYALQLSNIYAANSIPVKFRSIGVNPEARTSLSADEIAILAETEHDRWNVEKLLNGFGALPFADRMDILRGLASPVEEERQAAKKRKDLLKKESFRHVDIAPYGELAPGSRQYDTDIVTNLLDVIKN